MITAVLWLGLNWLVRSFLNWINIYSVCMDTFLNRLFAYSDWLIMVLDRILFRVCYFLLQIFETICRFYWTWWFYSWFFPWESWCILFIRANIIGVIFEIFIKNLQIGWTLIFRLLTILKIFTIRRWPECYSLFVLLRFIFNRSLY